MSITPPPFDRDYEVFDFEVLKEPWNEYILKDGALVRARLIILKIYRRKNSPENEIEVNSTNMFTVITNRDMRGTPTLLLQNEELMRLPRIPVEVASSKEDWNEYLIKKTNTKVRVRLILTEAIKIPGRFDPFGEPVYMIRFGTFIPPHQLGATGTITK